MAQIESQHLLDVLACDIEARPRGAPGLDELLPHVTRTARREGQLVVEFTDDAATGVAAFVDAERRCCGGLSWTLATQPRTTLTIGGTPAQIDALAALFAEA